MREEVVEPHKLGGLRRVPEAEHGPPPTPDAYQNSRWNAGKAGLGEPGGRLWLRHAHRAGRLKPSDLCRRVVTGGART